MVKPSSGSTVGLVPPLRNRRYFGATSLKSFAAVSRTAGELSSAAATSRACRARTSRAACSLSRVSALMRTRGSGLLAASRRTGSSGSARSLPTLLFSPGEDQELASYSKLIESWASRGYMVLSVNYRSGIGYGRAFRMAQHRGARGASEYQDVVAGAKYLRSRVDVDQKRIGLWGGSYGGYLTALGLARNSDIFAAGVDFHGVHDWSLRVAGLPLPIEAPDRNRLARESSPISSVDKWKSPVLLIHGDDDRNVEFAQTVNLVRRLRANGVYFEELIFPDEIHDLLLHKDWVRAYLASAEFFDKHLK